LCGFYDKLLDMLSLQIKNNNNGEKKNGHKGVLKLNVEDMVERAIENRLEQ
jgi:hypothetical protein